MTEYLEKCEENLTALSLSQPALYYIIQELVSDPNLKEAVCDKEYVKKLSIEQLFQSMFNSSPIRMRMYGSPKELEENVRMLMKFPGSHRYFNAEKEPYVTTPIIYNSLKGEQFICKLDLFPVLQSMIRRSFIMDGQQLLAFPMIQSMLQFEEERLDGQPEFVRFDQNVLKEIWNEIHIAQKKIGQICNSKSSFQILANELKNLNADELASKLKRCVPNNWDERNILASFNDIIESQNNPILEKAMLFTQAKILCETLQKVIDERPEMFRLYNETKKGPVTVRLFEDAGHRFVMKTELFIALTRSSNGSVRIGYTEYTDMYDTMKMEDVLQRYEEEVKNIEFIRYPIQRSKHRAVPVNGLRSGDFAVLAVDVLLDLLTDLLTGFKIFQRLGADEKKVWSQVGYSLSIIDTEYIRPHFLSRTHENVVKRLSRTSRVPVDSLPGRDIRNVNPDGFTLEDLKNELVYMGLTVVIPEILDHAEVVYEHVNRVKKEEFLRTCDLYDAIEQCQLICVFNRFPNFKLFLHYQGGCGRVAGLKCELCMDQQKALENQEPDFTTSFNESTESGKKEMKEKLSRLEQELLQKTQENEKLKETLNKLTSENKTKSETIKRYKRSMTHQKKINKYRFN